MPPLALINPDALRVVKAPVLGVVAPIGVLLTVPPLIVRASTTLVSVIQPVQVMVTPPEKVVVDEEASVVKDPVEGVEAPIVVLLIVPPVAVRLLVVIELVPLLSVTALV